MARVEYRFPMLDVDLVEFVHSLPSHLKIKNGIERYAFHRVLEGFTAPRIQWRLKSDGNFPKLDKPQDLLTLQNIVTQGIRDSILVKRYCSYVKMGKYLRQIDPGIIMGLEFMAHVEAYYYSEKLNASPDVLDPTEEWKMSIVENEL